MRLPLLSDTVNLSVLCLRSDGGGRSGVYLAIDANMELVEEEDTFDVFGYLKRLRQSRRGLIENLVRLTFAFVFYRNKFAIAHDEYVIFVSFSGSIFS